MLFDRIGQQILFFETRDAGNREVNNSHAQGQ
jgi:hypothetical protein